MLGEFMSIRYNLFYIIPIRLESVSGILSKYNPEDEHQITDEYEKEMKKIGATLSVISREIKDHKSTFFSIGNKYRKTKFEGYKRMVDDVSRFLDLAAYLSELDANFDRAGMFTLPQTGEEKRLEEVTIDDLVGGIPPIIAALDNKAMRDYGQSLDQIRKENEEIVSRLIAKNVET
ncbi:MAG: hypothetical protein ACTSWQ_10380 [Candidatus Thorarchaeota archaeon]